MTINALLALMLVAGSTFSESSSGLSEGGDPKTAHELHRFRFHLDADQTTPVNSFGGSGTGLARLSADGSAVELDIEHNLENPTAARVRVGGRRLSGPVALTLSSAASPIRASLRLDDELRKALFAGELYVEISTGDVPSGQIRGQISHDPGGAGRYVTISNLTEGQTFSPPIVISHGRSFRLFELGQLASDALVALAEDGVVETLRASALSHTGVLDVAVADRPVGPGESVTLRVRVDRRFSEVSAAGMLGSTNDGFFAIRGVPTGGLEGDDDLDGESRERDRAVFDVGDVGDVQGFGDYDVEGRERIVSPAYAFDAGSERNSERCPHLLSPPCDGVNERAVVEAERRVYVHAGIHGVGDVPTRVDWRGPVAEVAVSTEPPDLAKLVQHLNLDTPFPGAFVIQEPTMCEGSARITYTYSKMANFVYADLEFVGLPYRLSVTRPDSDPELAPLSVESTDYNLHLDAVEDGVWQLFLSGFFFNKTSTFWYGPDGILLGNEYDLDLEALPPGSLARDFPILQCIGTPMYEGSPDGRVRLRFEFAYDSMLDRRGTAGFFITVLPRDINNPDDQVTYYTEGGLPIQEAFSWDDALSLMQRVPSYFVSNTLENFPKPEFLLARPNRMPGFRGTVPESPLSDLWRQEGCGTRIVGSGPAAP